MLRYLLLLTLLLTGCATAPVAVQRPAQAESPFAFNGRVSVKMGDQRNNAGVRWVHGAAADEILLMGPLGQTMARICRDTQGVTLETPGKRYEAQHMETLMQQVLGWQLPLYGLRYWVTALPAPDSEFNIERDTNGQVAVLRQHGWEIRYSRYAAATPDALPLRLDLKREGVEVLLLIDEWEAQ
jgi:outer membrane lipoprotein LolB